MTNGGVNQGYQGYFYVNLVTPLHNAVDKDETDLTSSGDNRGREIPLIVRGNHRLTTPGH